MTDIHYTSQDGLRLYARSYGDPDAPLTVLCMHGLTRNHKDFDPMIEALGKAYHFISVDVRGRGKSDRAANANTYNPKIYARDMIALLDHLSISRTVLVGTSMGGLIAMLLARMAPERILGIVLNDIGPHVEQDGLNRIAAYAGNVVPLDSWAEAAQKTEASQSVAFPDYSQEDWLSFARRLYSETADGHLYVDYDPAITRTVGDTKPGLLTQIVMWRLFSAMKRFPLLIIRGARSDILSPETTRRMMKRHPDARLVTIPGRGHAPMLDEPEAVEAISAFLHRIEGRE